MITLRLVDPALEEAAANSASKSDGEQKRKKPTWERRAA